MPRLEEERALGGDSQTTLRTADQTETGIFWAYDGTPSLCAPPRLYNQIAMTVADRIRCARRARSRACPRQHGDGRRGRGDLGVQVLLRLLAPRQRYSRGAAADGNPATAGDPDLHAARRTRQQPERSQLHAAVSGVSVGTCGIRRRAIPDAAQVLGTDAIPFTFVSDEFNGVTIDNQGQVRPLKARSFANLSQAEEENGQSRIYLGIHWRFDKTEGIAQGRRVADYVFDHALTPVGER